MRCRTGAAQVASRMEPTVPEDFPMPPRRLLEGNQHHYKVSWCRHIVDRGRCAYQGKCHFVHKEHELRREGYGPTPEEAAKTGEKLPPELIAWWQSARKAYKEQKKQERIAAFQPRPAKPIPTRASPVDAADRWADTLNNNSFKNLPATDTDSEDSELVKLREQFPEEFAAMCNVERQQKDEEDTWQEATSARGPSAAQRQAAKTTTPGNTTPVSAAARKTKGQGNAAWGKTAAAAAAAQSPATTAPTTRAASENGDAAAATPPATPPPALAAVAPALQSVLATLGSDARRAAEAAMSKPLSAEQELLVAELQTLSGDVQHVLGSGDLASAACQARWSELLYRQSRYNSRAVEMVDRIEALCQAIEAVTSDTHTSEARSREVAELIGQRDKAEEEYLALTPYYHTMNRLIKQGKRTMEAAVSAAASQAATQVNKATPTPGIGRYIPPALRT